MIRRISMLLLAVFAFVSIVTLCNAQSQTLLTRHVRDVTTNGMARPVGTLPANQNMRIVLMLPLRNQADLNNFLQELYEPLSPSYRHFLTVKQFTERFGPTQEDYDTVRRFAEAHGLKVVQTSRNRMILHVSGTVANVESALHVKMGVYQHPTENRTFFAPDREPTPDLSVRLWHVSGLDNYSLPRPLYVTRPNGVQPEATTGSCPSASFCGSDMRAAYYGGTSLTGAGQSLGLLEFAGTDLADLTTYYTNAHQTNNVPITLLSVDGVTTSCLARQGCDDTEQTLDMTQALGMAPGMSSLVMYVGNGNTVDDVGILNAMATASPLNAQLSSSWAWNPADPSTDDPIFQEFATQGQNLFEASGDDANWKTAPFVWPADDPFLVAVGGTDLTTSSAGGPWASESAWVDGGGGVSPNGFAIPSWQQAAANGCSKCSKTLRNGPDVSANANFTFYVCADQTTCTANEFGGTSFAAPMWAGYLALANQQAVANGESTLGFINPAVYTIGESSSYTTDFHDVTTGSNGFPATTGYDLATGWGSPNGANLINALVGTGNPSFSLSANPSTITVKKGTTGTTTITATISGGFNSTIGLKGPKTQFKFSPNPIPAPGSGTSTMSIAIPSTAPTGTHNITITGIGGGLTETTTVTINITN